MRPANRISAPITTTSIKNRSGGSEVRFTGCSKCCRCRSWGSRMRTVCALSSAPCGNCPAMRKRRLRKKSVSSIVEALEAGLLDRASAMKELRGLSHETGLFGSVDDAQIAAAEEAPPPVMEAYAHAGA